MISTIIFDFDGTMVTSRELAIRLYNELARKYGYKEVVEQDVERFSNKSIVERLRLLDVPFARLPSLLAEMKRNYQQSVDSLPVVAGIPLVIEELVAAGYQLGLISTNSRTIIERFLSNHKIIRFKHLYCSGDLFGKSHKIGRFLKTHGLSKEETIYIGDELRDIEACKKAGIRFIAVTWGYDSAELLAQGSPDFIIHHPLELAPLLQQLTIQKR